jgi:hypothetical protein
MPPKIPFEGSVVVEEPQGRVKEIARTARMSDKARSNVVELIVR